MQYSIRARCREKGLALTLISEEGIGKEAFLDLLCYIVGDDKTLPTNAPEEDVWGKEVQSIRSTKIYMRGAELTQWPEREL